MTLHGIAVWNAWCTKKCTSIDVLWESQRHSFRDSSDICKIPLIMHTTIPLLSYAVCLLYCFEFLWLKTKHKNNFSLQVHSLPLECALLSICEILMNYYRYVKFSWIIIDIWNSILMICEILMTICLMSMLINFSMAHTYSMISRIHCCDKHLVRFRFECVSLCTVLSYTSSYFYSYINCNKY